MVNNNMKLILVLSILIAITMSGCSTKTDNFKDQDNVNNVTNTKHRMPGPNLTPSILRHHGN